RRTTAASGNASAALVRQGYLRRRTGGAANIGRPLMRTNRIALSLLALTALAALDLRPASAVNRPCCFQDTGKSATSCSFISFDQCMETARGLGGICKQNPSYLPSGERGPAYGAREQSRRARWQ